MTRLAAHASVGRDLLRSLEEGNWHTTHKVMAIFEALQGVHGRSLEATDEIEHYPGAEDNLDGTGSNHADD